MNIIALSKMGEVKISVHRRDPEISITLVHPDRTAEWIISIKEAETIARLLGQTLDKVPTIGRK